MSELIAEARVLVTPDTTAFRAQLTTQLAAATKGIVVPVPVTPVVEKGTGTAGLVAGQEALGASTAATTGAVVAEDAALTDLARSEAAGATASKAAADAAEAEALARRNAAKAAVEQARAQAQAGRGAAASALQFAGLRGATLAASGPFIAGAAAAIAFGKSIQIAVNFDRTLNVLQVTAGATADEMKQVSAAAIALGKDISLPGVSASDAAESMTELAKAGLSVQDSIAGARGVLQLATAAQISNADATKIAAGALNAFGLAGDQAVRVADVLANSANAAQGSITDMGIALGQSEAVARQVGLSLEDTAAILTLLAKNGLQSSDAGTSLRVALLRLVNPTAKAKEVLKDLNIQLRDQQGNIRPEVFADFAAATRGLTRAQQDAKAAIVFGQDAIRTEAILGREGTDSLHQMQAAVEQQGTAAKVAAASNKGLGGAMANLQNQLETTGQDVGQLATGPLQVLVDAFADGVQGTNDFIAALGRIPKTIPVPQFVGNLFGDDGDGESFGQKAGHKVVEGFKTALFLGPDIAGPLLDKLFPPDEIESGAAQAAANIHSAIEDLTASAKADAASAETQITIAFNKAFGTVGDILAQATHRARGNILRDVRAQGGQQSGLEEAMNVILAGGGSEQQQIANLREQAARQAKIIEDAGPGAAGDLLKSRRAAQAKLASINQQIVGIEKGIAADEKAKNDAIKRIHEALKKERDRAFLQAQDDARTRQQILITAAGDTKPVADDIRRNQQLRDLIQRQIGLIKLSALDEKAKQAAILVLKTARQQTISTIKSLRATDKQLREQQRQEALDQVSENLSLRTQIAEARDAGTAAIVRRIDAEIANQKKVVARARKAKKGVLEAILALEELRQKKRDLLNEQKKDAAADRFNTFDFLQATQGFASNLLGNLIPGFATGGLVGNTSAATSASLQGQITDPGVHDIHAENKLARAADRGVRPVQVDTTNALLRQILAALHGRQTQPPEARFNRRTSFSMMDTL